MGFSEEQIKSMAPTPGAFNAGKKLGASGGWQDTGKSDRAIWGAIKGSGKKPYMTEIDIRAIAYKCSCPSRQFPCKHAIGLMLLHGEDGSSFKQSKEPDWVSEWLDKRQARQEKKPEKEQTEEQKELSARSKEKTQARRIESVLAGAKELELWLNDLLRIGLLELPNKPASEFKKVSARMVDAKAPGLAGWVRSLAELNYQERDTWQDQALMILSRLFLLLRAIQKYEQLDPLWQQTIRNLAGWSQSSKELLADNDAETVKDQWLVLGQQEQINDDIVTQRNWLIGLNSGRHALILNFSTKFSSFETPLLAGSIMDAELAFFPSIQPLRAAVKMQRKLLDDLPLMPNRHDNWLSFQRDLNQKTAENPWLNDPVCLVGQTRLTQQANEWVIVDSDNRLMPLSTSVNFEQCLKWLAITGNQAVDVAGVMRDQRIIPLGIFMDKTYFVL